MLARLFHTESETGAELRRGGAAVAAATKDEPQSGKSKAPSKLKKKVT